MDSLYYLFNICICTATFDKKRKSLLLRVFPNVREQLCQKRTLDRFGAFGSFEFILEDGRLAPLPLALLEGLIISFHFIVVLSLSRYVLPPLCSVLVGEDSVACATLSN